VNCLTYFQVGLKAGSGVLGQRKPSTATVQKSSDCEVHPRFGGRARGKSYRAGCDPYQARHLLSVRMHPSQEGQSGRACQAQEIYPSYHLQSYAYYVLSNAVDSRFIDLEVNARPQARTTVDAALLSRLSLQACWPSHR